MAQLLEYIKMAVENIKANKGRSFLTMLGIIIGISSVIMIMAVGAGTTDQMNSELNDLAAGQIYIYTSDKAVSNMQSITEEDMEAIRSKVKCVEGVTPGWGESGQVYTSKGEFDISVSVGTEDMQLTSKLQIIRGRYLSEADIQEGRRVGVISKGDAIRLFGTDDIVGMDMDVTINGITQSVNIIGVRDNLTNGNFVSYTYEGAPVNIDMPYTAMVDYDIEYDGFSNLYVIGDKVVDSKTISDNVIRILESRHQSSGEGFFLVQDFNDVAAQMNSMMGMITAFISFVAAISLLVGGIGVMNIMLVSVTERTREIGIRKSLGAKTSSIMMQFLAESVIITALGGVIGIILGILGAFGICSVMSGSMNSAITPGIRVTTILLATLFSCAVGIFLGIYPARKAAKLSPIEALRRN